MDNKLGIGLVAGAMGLSIAFGATGLVVGLTKNGEQGKSAYEIAVENGFSGTEAEWLASLKGVTGDQGIQGPQGVQGEKGPDGISMYVGYDGYIWNGDKRTEFKVEEATDGYFEDTIRVVGTMSKYFTKEFADVSTNTMALMANYMPTIGKTQYSGVKVDKITVYAEAAGTLKIGTAKVADVVSARTTGATYQVTTTEYEVVAGANELTVNLSVAEDETIVLGGEGSSAKLCVVKGINSNDEAGNFALINGEENAVVISKTGEYADTLAVSVEATVSETKAVFDTVTSDLTEANMSIAVPNGQSGDYIVVSDAGAPYKYVTNYFGGKHITKIGIPVHSVASLTANPTMKVYVVDNSKTYSASYKMQDNALRVITLTIDKDTLTSTTVNKWVYFDVDIQLAENETLAFGQNGAGNDTIDWVYKKTETNQYKFVSQTGGSGGASICFDVYYEDETTYEQHVAELKQAEQEALAALNG